MQLSTRCFPLGALPYVNTESTLRMAAKLFDKMPSLITLPLLDKEESVVTRTLLNIPGIINKDRKVYLRTNSAHYKNGVILLDKVFNEPTPAGLEKFAFDGVFLDPFFNILKKFKSPNACINLLGPFSLAQMIQQTVTDEDVYILSDKSCRKLIIQAIAVKALWIIQKIKEISPRTVPVIVLEEPLLSQLGTLKRESEDVTTEMIINIFSKIVEKIKSAGALVAVQSMDKCDWQVPILSGVDIISFDAYNNPNNLSIIPEQVTEFLSRGGLINWAIVPVMNESIVKSLNIDNVSHRFFVTLQGLINAGVPENMVYNSALVSIQGNVDKLPLVFAEKAIILASQLSKRIPVKS